MILTVWVITLLCSLEIAYAQETCPDNERHEQVDGLCFKFTEVESGVTAQEAKGICKSYGQGWSPLRYRSDLIQAVVTTKMFNRKWSSAIIDGKRRKSNWMWVARNGSLDKQSKPLKYQGCFADGGNEARDLQGPGYYIDDNTPQRCIDKCGLQNYTYAGMQAGTYCYCGMRYGRYPAKSDCHQQCPGDPTQSCGNDWRNEIYMTDPKAYSNWFRGSPNGNGNCVAIDPTVNYQWVDEICGRKYPSYCEREEQFGGAACAEGSCFYYTKTRLNWYAARAACEEAGMRLAKIDSAAKSEVIKAHMDSTIGVGSVWIGITNTQWLDSNGDIFAEMPWEYEQPKDVHTHDCIQLTSGNEWQSMDCYKNERPADEPVHFICEKEIPMSTTGATVSPPETTSSGDLSTASTSESPSSSVRSSAGSLSTARLSSARLTTILQTRRATGKPTQTGDKPTTQGDGIVTTDAPSTKEVSKKTPEPLEVTKRPAPTQDKPTAAVSSEKTPDQTTKLPPKDTPESTTSASKTPSLSSDTAKPSAFTPSSTDAGKQPKPTTASQRSTGGDISISHSSATSKTAIGVTSSAISQQTTEITTQGPIPVNDTLCDPRCEGFTACFQLLNGTFVCKYMPDKLAKQASNEDDSGSRVGMFIGIAIAVIVLLLIIIIVVILVQKSKKERSIHPDDRKPRKPAGSAYAPSDPEAGDSTDNVRNGGATNGTQERLVV